jgi:hypothetical protein
MYSDTDSLVALSDSSYDTDLTASPDSDFDSSEYDPDIDIVDDGEEGIPVFSYNIDDPCIEVDVVFPDVKQCKEEVTHHAIIHNHAFKPTRTDHNKFRVVCQRANKGCKRRFYATTKIIITFEMRHKIGSKMRDGIIPTITKALNDQSKNIKGHEVVMYRNGTTEVTVVSVSHASKWHI